ncbi:MAG: cytochrome c [Chloroflexi bacterium]|nr:cytochrome c [Chloroflexota bacterium]
MFGNTFSRLIALAVLAGLALVLSVDLGATAAAPPNDAAKGKELWAASLCRRCHGEQGQGAFAGPRAGDTRTAEQWITPVRTPRAMMPAFAADKVSDQDIRDMLDYMKTLPAVTGWTPPQPAVQPGDHPGKLLVAQKRCIACHGETGPLTPFVNTGRTPTKEAVITELRTPRNMMPRFSPTQVSDDEAGVIADFLLTQFRDQPAKPKPAAPAPALPKTGAPLPFVYVGALGAVLATLGFAVRRALRGA